MSACVSGNMFAATLMFENGLWSWWIIQLSEFYDSVCAVMSSSHIWLFRALFKQACKMEGSIPMLLHAVGESTSVCVPKSLQLISLSSLIAYERRGPAIGVSIHVEGNTLSFIRMCVGVQRLVNPDLQYGRTSLLFPSPLSSLWSNLFSKFATRFNKFCEVEKQNTWD